jgi:hypothetical protein
VTLNPYAIYIELGAAALFITLAAGSGYYVRGLACEAALETDRAAQSQTIATAVLAERASAAATAAQDRATETQHAQTIVHIDSAPAISTPVFVCGPGPVYSGSVPGAERETGGIPTDPEAGRGQPVDRGRDIRPAVEALKKRLEKVMADYRQEDAEWRK